MRDALWQDVCCSALLLVIVPLCEQHTFVSKLAMIQACYLLSAVFYSVRDALCQDVCCSALLPVIVGAATFQKDMAVPEACRQAVVCTAALISGRCVLPVSVLRCTVVRHCLFVRAANFHR